MPQHGHPQRRSKYISKSDNLALIDFKRDFEQEPEIEITGGEYARVDSNKDIHFTNLLATNETEEENLSINGNRIVIQNVTILSTQQLNYRLWFFSSDKFYSDETDEIKVVDFIDFDLPSKGKQYGNTGLYMYSITDLNMLYNDVNQKSQLHAGLENLSTTSKNPPDSYVIIQVMYKELDEVN